MPPKPKKKRDRRTFTIEQKRAIVAEITPKRKLAAVARTHDVMPALLRQWRKKLASNGHASNGHAELPAPIIDAPPATAPEVQASLEQALADIERAGKTIQAIRQAARKVFGV